MKWKLTDDVENDSQALVDTIKNGKRISWKFYSPFNLVRYQFTLWWFLDLFLLFSLKGKTFNFIQSLIIQTPV